MPRAIFRILPILCLALTALSCQLTAINSTVLPKGGVTHVVLMWLYDRADMTAQEQILGASHQLAEIPGVLNVTAGRPLPSDKPFVDSSFDLAFVITFRSEVDLNNYLVNPTHVEIKKNTLDRYVRKFLDYNIVTE